MLLELKCMARERSSSSTEWVCQESQDKLNEAWAKETKVKQEELEARKIYQVKQNTLANFSILKEAKALGLIWEEDFWEKCKVAFGL